MELSKQIEPVTVLKTKSAQLIRLARESGRPIVITQNGKATAVLQDVHSYERMQKALLLLRFFAKGDREVRSGKGLSQGQAELRVRQKLSELRGE
jgi:prevent-host-death family protein